ncbi:TPA: hypothetical protein PXP81_000709 [Yersinia enterocolitica]|nr:hypothetical protein [Yersinia enterocolitica]
MTEINKEQLAVWANGYRCDSDIAIKTMAKMLFDFMDRAEKEPVTWTEMPFSFEELEQMHGATFANGYIRGWARKCESVTMKGSLYTTPQLNSPDGYKLVPTEITKAMRDAWDSAPNCHEDDDVNMCNAYRAMIAAAPEKPL